MHMETDHVVLRRNYFLFVYLKKKKIVTYDVWS